MLIEMIVAIIISQPKELKAVLTGPETKDIGRVIFISSKGTVANKIKFDSNADPKEWQPVQFLPNTNSTNGANGDYGIIFSTEIPGKYTFFLAATDAQGNIATAQWTVTVGKNPIPAPPSPGPLVPVPAPPSPAPTTSIINKGALLTAFGKDLAAGSTVEQKKVLGDIYRACAKDTVFDKRITNPAQIFDIMRAVAGKAFSATTLANLRQEIANQEKQLKLTSNTPLTDALRQSLANTFNEIASALQ